MSLVRIAEPIESQDVHFDYVLVGFHLRGKHFITWDEEQVSLTNVTRIVK